MKAREKTREAAIAAMQREIRVKKQAIRKMGPKERMVALAELSEDEMRLKKLAGEL